MFRLFGAIAIIMLIVMGVSLAPEAMPAVGPAVPNAAKKGDRLDIGRHRVACAWQQDGAACEHEGSGVDGGVRKVRVVPIYRMPAFDQRPAPELDRLPSNRDRCASLPPSCVTFREASRSMT